GVWLGVGRGALCSASTGGGIARLAVDDVDDVPGWHSSSCISAYEQGPSSTSSTKRAYRQPAPSLPRVFRVQLAVDVGYCRVRVQQPVLTRNADAAPVPQLPPLHTGILDAHARMTEQPIAHRLVVRPRYPLLLDPRLEQLLQPAPTNREPFVEREPHIFREPREHVLRLPIGQ